MCLWVLEKMSKFVPLKPIGCSSNGTIDSVYCNDGRELTYEEKIKIWYSYDYRQNFWNDYPIEHLKTKPVQVFIEEMQDINNWHIKHLGMDYYVPKWRKIAVGTEIKKVKLIPNHLGEIMTTAERVVPRYLNEGRVMFLRNIDFDLRDVLLAQIGLEKYYDNGKLFFRKLKKSVMQVSHTPQNLNLCASVRENLQ